MSYQYMTRDIIHSPTGCLTLSAPYLVWVDDDRGEEE